MYTLSCFSCIGLFSTLQALDPQAPLSMGILQARILEWVASPSSRGSSQPRDRIQVSNVFFIGMQVLYHYCHLGSPFRRVIHPSSTETEDPELGTFTDLTI